MIYRHTQLLTKLMVVALCPLLLFACSSQHVLVKKTDMEAADQCLLAQQARHGHIDVHQQQLDETLALLRQTLEAQQESDSSLRELVEVAGQKQRSPNCTQQPSLQLGSGALDKIVVGEQEKILLTNLGIVLPARIDTGATTSSLHAKDIELFERDGEEWVRFSVHDPDLDQMVEIERKRARRVLITQSNTDEPERRPVVEMRLTVGSNTQLAEFTLSDRSHLEHPALIGRNVLRDLMIVDVAQSFTLEPKPPASSENGRGENSSRKEKASAQKSSGKSERSESGRGENE